MKCNVYIALAVVSFVLIHGAVGGMEHEQISMGPGMVLCLTFTAMWVYFAYRAKLFYWRRSVPGIQKQGAKGHICPHCTSRQAKK